MVAGSPVAMPGSSTCEDLLGEDRLWGDGFGLQETGMCFYFSFLLFVQFHLSSFV